MPISDLSLVSISLRQLLQTNIGRLTSNPALVTLGYPEDQAGAENTINLHLYHIAEDPFNRNLPSSGQDANSAATSPMTLSLFYLMTAHHNSDKKAETEQQIMGYALKTLHDFALIGDGSKVADATGTTKPVLVDGINDGSTWLEIVLRPLTPEDALAYWASEQQQAVRLAAYYEVRLVQLDPEKKKSRDDKVMSVGQSVAPMREVSLAASRSAMRFDRPSAIGATLPDMIEVSPARVFLTRPSLDTPAITDSNHFWLTGSGLLSGIRRRLVITHESWRGKVPQGEIALEAAVQPAGPTSIWGVAFDNDRVDIRVADSISYIDTDGAAATLPIVPGTYRARVDVIAGDRVVGMATREVLRQSNEVLFQIAPRILSADPPVAIAGVPGAPPPGNESRTRITLDVAPRFNLNLDRLHVALIVDGETYQRTGEWDPTPARDDRRFRTTMYEVTFQPMFDVTEPGLHAVRLRVDGVDSQPFWLTTGP